ncbi:unnamed protein product [Didymodactylos carnosus]|uniref:Insulin-like domain-containing protein n=1 Tax=Didymodactylos carnosus TaxID=1234261 RepID=A0A814L5N2_9BILA|nr:unnamed protein product [Didymodactylos carnosus]CAF1058793.1 unnamed protein product [Didymodactylos carnosus]CAF3777605.1 unnamed protein product [Didymodactylos carnosus]CAF3827385.1 unnamed protein product [Didymodactylos carnosus]
MFNLAIIFFFTILCYTPTTIYCYTPYSNNLKKLENVLDSSSNDYRQPLQQRSIQDGTEYTIKDVGVTYRQRLSKDEVDANNRPLCTIEYNDQMLKEDEIIDINSKFYKVEECQLSRAYHACGPNIFHMLKIVCSIAEQFIKKRTPSTNDHRNDRSSSSLGLLASNTRPKLITESCCQNLCTIPEMTRYCPRHE